AVVVEQLLDAGAVERVGQARRVGQRPDRWREELDDDRALRGGERRAGLDGPRTAALEIDDDGVGRTRAGLGSVGRRDAGVGDEAGQREDDRKGMHGGGVYARFARPARPVFTASRKPVGDAGPFALETITVTEPIRRNAAMDHLSIA